VWQLRFAPTELGVWTYTITLTDASGTTVVTDPARLRFTAIAPTNPNNHGFLRVSPTDRRYFDFSDGTPFVGVGPGPVLQSSSFDNDQEMALVGPGGANFSRTWMSGHNVSGSSWAPWAARFSYDGNVPRTSLTTDEAYGDGIYSFTLPGVDDPTVRCT